MHARCPWSPCGACPTKVTRPMTSGVCWSRCPTRYLPESFGPWTRVWSQLRREGGGDALDGRAGLDPRGPGQRVEAGAPGPVGRQRAGLSWSWWTGGHGGRRAHTRPPQRPRAPPERAGRQATDLPAHSACLASRGRPRSPRPLPATLAKSFENTTKLSDRLAPGRLHRHDAAPSLAGNEPAGVLSRC